MSRTFLACECSCQVLYMCSISTTNMYHELVEITTLSIWSSLHFPTIHPAEACIIFLSYYLLPPVLTDTWIHCQENWIYENWQELENLKLIQSCLQHLCLFPTILLHRNKGHKKCTSRFQNSVMTHLWLCKKLRILYEQIALRMWSYFQLVHCSKLYIAMTWAAEYSSNYLLHGFFCLNW